MSIEVPPDQAERTLRAPWWLYIALIGLIGAKAIELVVTLSSNPDGLPFLPIVRVIFAGGWLVALLVIGVALWRRQRCAFRWIVPLLNLYALTHVLWQLLFFRSDFDRGRLPFQIVISALLVLPLWAIGWQRRWFGRTITTAAE
jgi:hypothetical protein